MLACTLLALSFVSVDTGSAATLSRVFTRGEKLGYRVNSSLHIDRRGRGLDTFIPEQMDVQYGFTLEVRELKADGIAVVHYKRPTLTTIQGETFSAPERRKTEKVNYDLLLTISPVNDILEIKDLAKKPAAKKGEARWITPAGRQIGANIVGQFVGEIYRLALFVGSFDSALDFSPRLPLDQVKVGDTWKKTVSYQPQQLKGKKGEQAVQRLDYTYTYRGAMKVGAKSVERVEATLSLNTDVGHFINQLYDLKPEDTGLKGIPLKMEAKIEFNLDPKTKRTLSADAVSEGGFKIVLTDDPESPLEEENLRGRTHLKLVSQTTVPSKAAPKKATSGRKGR